MKNENENPAELSEAAGITTSNGRTGLQKKFSIND
jgi:hypothetical protein